MKVKVKDYINHLKEDGHTKVSFRYQGKGDSILMDIDKFLEEYNGMYIGLNGEFIDQEGNIDHNSFIKRTL